MKKLLILLMIVLPFVVVSQGNMSPNIYFNNFNYYNPAAGWDDSLRLDASIYVKHRWVESDVYNKAPNVFANYLGTTANRKHRYMVGYLFDDYSFYTRNLLYLGYAYAANLKGKSTLHFAARSAWYMDVIETTGIAQPLESKIASPRLSPDLDLGAHFNSGHFRASLSVRNAFANSVIENENPIISNQREFNLLLAFSIRLGQNFALSPFALLQYERRPDLDAGLNLDYRKKIELSAFVRVLETRNILAVRGAITNKIYLGLSTDWSFLNTDMNTDVLLQYRF